MRSEVYLLSSADPPPAEGLFHGYCFHGADFVFGDAGARAFAEARGRRIGAGEDGCYVSVEARGDEVLIGSDFGGYKKVFYLCEDGFWAVSNSLFRLVEHLRRHGRPIVPNYGQLAAMAGGGAALCQPTSFATPIQNVALLPVGTALRIGPRGAKVLPVVPRGDRPASYEAALARFLSVWVSRFMTVIARRRAVLRPDVSGGIDSRAVLGLVHRATELLGDGAAAPPRYRSGTEDDAREDLLVARSLAERFGLSLNEGPARKGPPSGLDPFELWRDLNLGAYHRIYWPRRGLHPFRIAAGGGGGENHRPFYRKDAGRDAFGDLAQACAEAVRPAFLRPQFGREMAASMRDIQGRSGAGADRLMLHYRHFRNRFHAGREPQYRIKLVPLGSRLLEDCAALAGPRRVETAQILYDVMAGTVPGLLDVPFDDPAKAPGAEVRAALTSVPLGDDLAPGRFFAAPPGRATGPRPRWEKPLARLRREFDAAASMPFVGAFRDAALLAAADEVLSRAERRGHFANAAETQPITAVLATAMVHP